MSQEKAKPTSQPEPLLSSEDAKITGLKLVTIAPATESSPQARALDVAVPGTIQAPSVPPPAHSRDPYIGCTIDNRYKVESVLGEGGMGVVYQCRHKIIGKKVAMKILRADLARDREVTERFLIEARAASSIGDEHIIDISDFGQLPDGSAYFVMEFLEGQPLSSQIVDEQPMDPDRIVPIALQIARGLGAAHSENIVHRDLKPDNVYLITKGGKADFVKILDFGIAKVTGGANNKLTQAGSVFGTPHYMSPEQAAGAPVDHRGDIYSLGIILYELTCGKVPFDADNFMGILTQHMYKAPVSVREKVPGVDDISPGLEAIIAKCISKKPEQRYETMEELADDLVRLREGEIPFAVEEMMDRSGSFTVPEGFFQPPPATEPVVEIPASVPTTRFPWGALLGVLLVGGGGLGYLYFGGQPRAEPVQVAPPVAAPAPTISPEPEPAEPAQPPPVQVVVGVDPLSAHVFVGEQDLGTSPVVVPVAQGESVAISIREEGYESIEMTLDGSDKKLSIALEPIKKPAAVAPRPRVAPRVAPQAPKRPAKPKPQIGGGEIVNPWAN